MMTGQDFRETFLQIQTTRNVIYQQRELYPHRLHAYAPMEVLLWIVHSIQAPPSRTATRVLHWCSSSLHHTEQDRSTTDYRLGFGIRALSLIQRLLIRGDVRRIRRRVHFTSLISLL